MRTRSVAVIRWPTRPHERSGVDRGKVVDASAVAALVRGRVSAVPSLALAEVRAVLPETGAQLADLLDEPAVVVGELHTSAAAAVADLLERAGDGVFDALAGEVVQIARRRGWPVLTADPARLRRLDAEVELDLL